MFAGRKSVHFVNVMGLKEKTTMSEEEIQEAVDEVMGEIDDHEALSSDVERDDSISFLKGIIEECNLRIQAMKQDSAREITSEEESDEDGD